MECTNLLCGNYVLTIHPNVQPIENFNEINVFHFALKKDASIQTHSSKRNQCTETTEKLGCQSCMSILSYKKEMVNEGFLTNYGSSYKYLSV